MVSLLLAVIYLAFISLGLPDALLGSAWPVMQGALNAPLSFAGAVSMVISGGTILSSLLSDRMTRKLGAGLVTALSVLMTAAALLGFSLCSAPWMLILWAVPYGLGAGAVDAALLRGRAAYMKALAQAGELPPLNSDALTALPGIGQSTAQVIHNVDERAGK